MINNYIVYTCACNISFIFILFILFFYKIEFYSNLI